MPTQQLILNLLIDLSTNGNASYTQYGRFAPFAAGNSPLLTSKAWIVNNNGVYTFYSQANQGSDKTVPTVSKASGVEVCIRVGAVGGSWPSGYSPDPNGALYGWDPGGDPTAYHALMITAVFGRHANPGTQTWASPFGTPANPSVVGNLITEVFTPNDFDTSNGCTMSLGAVQNVTGPGATDRYLFNVGAVLLMSVPGGGPAQWVSCGHDPDMDVTM
jgi:hypothetical protein